MQARVSAQHPSSRVLQRTRPHLYLRAGREEMPTGQQDKDSHTPATSLLRCQQHP